MCRCKMKTVFYRVLAASFVYLSAFHVNAKKLTIPIEGYELKNADPIPVEIEWEESWFGERPATVYNHNLARMASLLAEISYVDVAADRGNNTLRNAYRILGVEDSNIDFHYDVDYSDPIWGNDQCAFSFAHKEIQSAFGRRTLLFIVIRGTPLNANEWISNLNVSNKIKEGSPVHEGFSQAALQIHSEFIAYLLRNKIDPAEAFLFITGHSRGAAVTNVLASNFSHDDFFETDNIYAYTFAAPNVTTYPPEDDDRYGYIWNIVNAEDVVPTVPLNRGKWKYRKFGHVLTLANNWNIEQSLYNKEYLPRMNAYYTQFVGRDYFPFKLGPFIPIQITHIFNTLNKNVGRFYSGPMSLHGKGVNLMNRMFPSADTEKKPSKEKTGERIGRIKDWLNVKSNGLVDYASNAFVDMHTSEGYLAWMISLDEHEAFSTQGSSQLLISGSENLTVRSADGNVLVRVIGGHLVYGPICVPVAARQISPDKVAIGIPGTLDFEIIITEDSLLPTPASIEIEHYDASGVLVETCEKQRFYLRRGQVFHCAAGKITAQENCVALEQFPAGEGRSVAKSAQGHPTLAFRISPEFSLDTNLNFGTGVQVGSQAIYASILTENSLSKIKQSFSVAQGIGTQQKLIWRVTLDAEAFAKFCWVFAETDDSQVFNFIPATRISLSLKFAKHMQLFVAGMFDFHIDGFNDSAFSPLVRQETIPNFSLGNDVHVNPSIQFGLRF